MLPAVMCTDRLELRRWRIDDLEALMDAIGVSLEELRVWMPWARAMVTAEAERAVIEASSARFDCGEDFEYFLFEVSSSELVGAAGLHLREPKRAEIGYWVRSDRHRRGYATEAARALTSAAFEHVPSAQTIEIRMDGANVASAGVPSRLGYELIGEESRDIVAPGHTGRGLVWRTTRATWRV
jgi:RimJ/RimL family protein N-acetyltransferase